MNTAIVGAILLFGTSLIALIVRAGQRWTGRHASFVGWGAVVAGSLLLAFVFAGVSGAFYSETFEGGSNPGAGGYDADPSDGGGAQGEGAPAQDAVAPGLEGLAEGWAALDDTNKPLFVPGYLPFSVEGVQDWKEADGAVGAVLSVDEPNAG